MALPIPLPKPALNRGNPLLRLLYAGRRGMVKKNLPAGRVRRMWGKKKEEALPVLMALPIPLTKLALVGESLLLQLLYARRRGIVKKNLPAG